MSGGHGFSYRPALDGLRAVAVLAVFAYHLDWGWARGGFLGVDVFFVLSGYLITSLLLAERDGRGRISLGSFWARRARRLLPAVLVLLVAITVYAATMAPPTRAGSLRADGLATLLYVANWHLIGSGQSYFEMFTAPSPLRHMWSLAIEEQFYLVWPLIVAATLRMRSGRQALAVLSGAAITASAVVMALQYEVLDPSRAYYGTDSRVHMLLAGALLAMVLHRWEPGRRSGRVVGLVGVASGITIAVAIVRLDDHDPFFYRGGSLLFAVAVGVLIASILQPGRHLAYRLLSSRPMRWIGMISYGVYLWHWPVIVVLTRSRVGLDGPALDVLHIVTTFALATVSYYAIERPIRYGAFDNRRLLTATPAAIALVAVMLVVTTAMRHEPLPAALDARAPITAPRAPLPTSSSVSSAPEDRGLPATMAVVGDSIAGTLVWGFEEVAPRSGITVIPATFAGCGIASGFVVDERGRPLDWSTPCFENVPPAHEKLVADHDPDLVVWLSTWELANRLVGDRVVRFGTPEGDEVLRAAIDEASRRLTAGGARLVYLAAAPRAPSDYQSPSDDENHLRLARILEQSVADDPEQRAFVDLATVVCPGGPPCPDKVDGVRLRHDGAHFTESTAVRVAERVLPLILDAYRRG